MGASGLWRALRTSSILQVMGVEYVAEFRGGWQGIRPDPVAWKL